MCMDFQFFWVLHDNSSPNSSYRTKLLQKTFPIIKSCTGEIIRIYVLIHAINKLIPYGTSLSLKEKKPIWNCLSGFLSLKNSSLWNLELTFTTFQSEYIVWIFVLWILSSTLREVLESTMYAWYTPSNSKVWF